jgi:glycosyltransferase involved in cell wall biosynthesis
MRSELEQLVGKLNLADRIEFCGFVESVAEEMRRADIFCRPSLSEGMPLTLLEAMASGLPVVVTPVAGVPEVVAHNQNGILVPKNDPASLSTALSDLLADEQRCRELSTAAREEVVNEYSWQSRTEQILGVYRDALS